jgi:hypothetical protein
MNTDITSYNSFRVIICNRKFTVLPYLGLLYLVAVCVKKVEDAGEVVLELARAEEVEEDHHVGHG